MKKWFHRILLIASIILVAVQSKPRIAETTGVSQTVTSAAQAPWSEGSIGAAQFKSVRQFIRTQIVENQVPSTSCGLW